MGLEQDKQPLVQPAPVYQSYQTQPQYAYQPQQPQYAYQPQQPAYQTTTTVSSHGQHHHHHDGGYTAALIVFILGWFISLIWIGGIFFLKSHNKTARSLGIASIILFCICVVIAIILISTNN